MYYRIERSRSIIPALIKAITMMAFEDSFEEQLDSHPKHRKSFVGDIVNIRHNNSKKRNAKGSLNSKILSKKRKLNKDYFYDLLFTRKNLKLVHIVCHDKQEHLNKKCDKNMMFC